MDNINITPIIEIIIALIGAVVTYFLIPYLKSKMTANQFSYLEGVVKTAVYGAEVLFGGSARGDEKREYVLSYVKNVCESKHITFNEDEVRQILEKSWLNLTSEVTRNKDVKN